ncbi:AAA family ATPase [Pseudomonas sp. B14-6]|uniref:AAA family ATPase n=1 Tax=Pseudomonas sp. B14-6 TaxID=2738843 RepID=UPI00155F12BF|nr:AAA family ATPase [Pseudomonas sp. B14-6]QKG66731.1 AAA family ATPase [Pseudomonas sp. B14-6]
MIKNIVLRNVSSYAPNVDSIIGPLTRVNIFYGQNGTGKTTISNFLQAPNELAHKSCRADPAEAEREVLVYNHAFTEKNFHASVQPGVFTLNEGNIEAEAALKAAEDAIKVLSDNEQTETADGKELKAAQEALSVTLKDKVWLLKKPFDSGSLNYCFGGINTKERLLERVVPLKFMATVDTFESLASEASELQSASDTELDGIASFSFYADDIETKPIFQEAIAGSGDSYLSALIQQLGNSDWIKQSFKFVDKNDEHCPFCQQALPNDFYVQLEKVFDKTYELRISELTALETRYKKGVDELLLLLDKPQYQAKSFLAHVVTLKSALQQNIQRIQAKMASPSAPVSLTATSTLIANLNAAIQVEQDKINAINLKIKDKKTHLEQIKERFWNCFRGSCDAMVIKTTKEHREYDDKLTAKRDAVRLIRDQIKAQEETIVESRAKITNIDQAVLSINGWLGVLGLQGFVLLREEGEVPQYRLHRPDKKDDVFKTLSEGEKTLISFLYFLEVCNGDLDDKTSKLKSNRIIVIDDPISSLSHNYIYDIASLIRRQVLSPKTKFKQVFILTHNLFFFHEMIKLMQEDKEEKTLALFRITKAQFSSVATMQEKEVQNDYQSFWQTIKDALAGRTSTNVIPNMMRNILEYYFTFVHRQDSLRRALTDLADENPEFRALFRYINRESHSDAINLTDFGEIDPAQYIARFRDVFVKTKFESHFDKMMS